MVNLRWIKAFAKPDRESLNSVVTPLESVRVGYEKSGDASDDNHSVETGSLSIESLRTKVAEATAVEGHDTTYDRKAQLINLAIQDIGMGKYQWELFTLCGFGWLADNLWLQGVALILSPMAQEFGVSDNNSRYTTLSLFLGLCIGACFWGMISDVIGRRPAFNTTLLLAGIFGLAAGGAPNWIGACALFACLGLGVGGNLPVDGALFLEFLPSASGRLLTLLSIWWPVGQLISSLIAWAFIPNYSCASDATVCTKSENFGWRYTILTLGAFTFAMWFCRFFLFTLYESPKLLLARGRQDEAVEVVQSIALYNKRRTWLTEEVLNEVGGDPLGKADDSTLSRVQLVKRAMSKFSTQRFKPLFNNGWKLAVTTILLWFIWAEIGMGYPLYNAFLPQYLAQTGGSSPRAPSIVYRNYAITSIVGVPGSALGCVLVDIKYFGRKGTMALSTVVAGIMIFLFTLNNDANYQLTFSCLEAFFQNISYGVLYAYTPEVFPAANRGTGSGLCSFLNRVAGLCAPIVAINASATKATAPIYASGGLFIAAFVAMCGLPIETRGRAPL